MATYVFPAVMSKGILSNKLVTATDSAARVWGDKITETGLSIEVVAADGTYTRSTGSFITAGVKPGDSLTFSGFVEAGNNATKIVASVTATVITVTDNTGLVDEAAGGNEAYTGANRPEDNSRGFMIKASAPQNDIFIGSSSVTDLNGLVVAAGDVVAGAIDGSGATEIYQIVAGAGPTYLILEIG